MADTRYCGAKTRAGTPCKNVAGYKTDHVGEGRCHLHGGKSPGAPLKHGRYATAKSRTLRKKLQEHLQDQDPLDLTQELAFLRALLDHFRGKIEEAEEEYTRALEKFPEVKPKDGSDPLEKRIGTITLIVENIRRVADTISKMQSRELLTAAEMSLAIVVLAGVLREEVKDEQLLQRIFDKYSGRLKVPRLTAGTDILIEG